MRGSNRGRGRGNAPRRHAEDDDQANSRQRLWVANNGPPIVRTDRPIIPPPSVRVNTDMGWGGRGRGGASGISARRGDYGSSNGRMPPTAPRSEWRREIPSGPSSSRQPDMSSAGPSTSSPRSRAHSPSAGSSRARVYSPSHPVRTSSWRPERRDTDRRSRSPPPHKPTETASSSRPDSTARSKPLPPAHTSLPSRPVIASVPEIPKLIDTPVKVEIPTRNPITSKPKPPKRPRSPTPPTRSLPNAHASSSSSTAILDIKPNLADLDFDTTVSPLTTDDLTRPFGCYSCSISEMPADTLVKDQPDVRKAARTRFRAEVVARLRGQGRKVYGTLWRDDGVAFDWHLIGYDTKLVPGHKDEVQRNGGGVKKVGLGRGAGGEGSAIPTRGGRSAVGSTSIDVVDLTGEVASKRPKKNTADPPSPASTSASTTKKPKKVLKPNSASVVKARNEASGKAPVKRVCQPPPYTVDPIPRSTTYEAQVSAFLGEGDSRPAPNPSHVPPPSRSVPVVSKPPPAAIDKSVLDGHYASLRVLLAEIDNWDRMKGEATQGMEDILSVQIKRKEKEIFEMQRVIEEERRRLGI